MKALGVLMITAGLIIFALLVGLIWATAFGTLVPVNEGSYSVGMFLTLAAGMGLCTFGGSLLMKDKW